MDRHHPPLLLRRLFILYPKSHRKRYGDEMWEVVAYRWRDGSGKGRNALRLFLTLAVDTIWNAVRMRLARVAEAAGSTGTSAFVELRRAFRGLRKAPGFTATTLVVLAGAVAVNVAVWGFVRGTLFDRPPWTDPERIVVAWGSHPTQGQIRDVISGSNYIDLAERTRSLTTVAAVHGDEVLWQTDEGSVVVDALEVTVDFLDVLGVSPALGRDFGEQDRYSGSPRTALISHDFWQDRLDGDPAVVGRSLSMDGQPATIIGVLPEAYRFLGTAPVMIPLRDDLLAAESRTHHHYHVIGRLREGATVAQATREMSGIMTALATEDPRIQGWSVRVEPFHEVTIEAVEGSLWLLAAAVAGLLAIAVVNLASLFRVRALSRQGELSLRIALGAGRGRVAVAVATETLVVCTLGGILGLVLAPPLLGRLAAMAPPTVTIPGSAAAVPALRATLDWGMAAAALAATVAAGLLIALPGARATLRRGPAALEHLAGRVSSRLNTTWLVGAELALATALCAGSVLTFRNAAYLAGTDVGLNPDGLLTVYFGDTEEWSLEDRNDYMRQVIESVEGVPGVVRVGLNDYVPFQGEDDFEGVRFPERPDPPPGEGPREEWRRVSEGLFDAAGMRILRGRALGPADFQTTPAAVVINEAFAAKHYPGQEPVGQRVMVTERGYTDMAVVGVVADVRSRGPSEPAPPVFYVPFHGASRGHMALYARTSGDPMSYASQIREAIQTVDPSQPVLPPVSMRELVDRTTAIPRMIRDLVGALAAGALALAGTGVFGLVGYTVRSRRGEMGIRMALGATAAGLESHMVRRILPVTALSIAAGLGLAVALAAAAAGILHGVRPVDPASLSLSAAAMGMIALAAAWIPARAVSRIDPTESIRAE